MINELHIFLYFFALNDIKQVTEDYSEYRTEENFGKSSKSVSSDNKTEPKLIISVFKQFLAKQANH